MFLIDQDRQLTEMNIVKIIGQFETRDKPRLIKLKHYYQGIQEITHKETTDVGKPNNKVVVNYAKNIVDNFRGYITGIPITYQSDQIDILDILNYNDYKEEDSEFLRQALIFGKAFEINYIDEDSMQRFKVLDTLQCIPIYNTTVNQDLLYVIRYYPVDSVIDDDDTYIIELYSKESTKVYKSSAGFSSCSFIEERPNYFNQVPITEFKLNEDETGIFEPIMSLQDAYNKLVSSEIDDFESFCDAYLVLKGINAEPEDLKLMKENRVLVMDSDAQADYLTKSVSDTQIVDMLQRINDSIHKIANSPDFNDEKFLSQSGIAMKYKLTGFENASSSIVNHMTKALQKRIELIFSIFTLKGDAFADVDIQFTRNLPVNVVEIAQVVAQLKGIVSDETLLKQIPFIDDVDEEIKLLDEQKEKNMELYQTNMTQTETIQEDDEE